MKREGRSGTDVIKVYKERVKMTGVFVAVAKDARLLETACGRLQEADNGGRDEEFSLLTVSRIVLHLTDKE
jgi:hypothetical protein